MRKIIIGGTGRAGTTLLFKLFQQCGLIAGQLKGGASISEFASAGLEETLASSLELLNDDRTQIIKTPWAYQICEDQHFNSETVSFVIVPIRKQFASSMSRTINETAMLLDNGQIDRALAMINSQHPGGIWYSNDYLSQDSLANQAYVTLVYWCAVKNIPVVAVPFPDSFENPQRICNVLRQVFLEYQIDEAFAVEWLQKNYNSQKLTLSSDNKEIISEELRACLTNKDQERYRNDGLMFIKALDKLIKSYKYKISILEDEISSFRARRSQAKGVRKILRHFAPWI
jgi:hypothetical protein